MRRLAIVLMLCGLAQFASPVMAKSFRWSSQGDILTLDPHSQSESLNLGANLWVYEPLVRVDEHFQPIPALAVSWTQISPTQWRFKMREGVKFSDGRPFTADDAVFSILRAEAPSSQFKAYVAGIKAATAVDPMTLDITLIGPNPVFLQQLTVLGIMSKSWAEENNSVLPQNFAKNQQTFAASHAMGTGPFMLQSREPNVKTVYVENPNWWGKAQKKGNVTEIIYTPIKNGHDRTMALLRGDLDFLLDPVADDLPQIRQKAKVIDGNEYRTIFIGLDQGDDELKYSSLKGKNPLRDVRVREALYRAIDISEIKQKVMRNLSLPTGAIVAPQVRGWSPALAKRLPYDVSLAKSLLTKAGFASGFDITLDCPNNRYINDVGICEAVAAMWGKIGVTTKVNSIPRGEFLAKLANEDTSAYLFGWGVPTFDAYYTLQALVHSKGDLADGEFNYGHYSNKTVDALIDAIKIESDVKKRDEMMQKALKLFSDELGSLPLHDQVIPWATQKNINLIHRADNRPVLDWIVID